jgi:4-hydroxy-4-methyl-2-oxoglutarate aldolase
MAPLESIVTNTTQLVHRLTGMPVALLSDCLDKVGARGHVMNGAIRSVAGAESIAGVAFPLQAVPSPPTDSSPDDGGPTYNLGIAAVDVIPAGAVVVVATGGFCGAAAWGELLSTRARALGAVAVVTDGAVRDAAGLRRMEFPTYASTLCPLDAQDRLSIVTYDQPVVCGGAPVHPGDLVVADVDGVVVLPAALAEQIAAAAEARRSGEDVVKRDLVAGRRVSDVFSDYGIL